MKVIFHFLYFTIDFYILLQPVRQSTPGARMVTTTIRPQSPITTTASSLPSSVTTQLRVASPSIPAPPLHIRQPLQVQTKLPTAAAHLRPPTPVHMKNAIANLKTTTTAFAKPPTPSLLPKPTAKEKEKKTFSSAGYT